MLIFYKIYCINIKIMCGIIGCILIEHGINIQEIAIKVLNLLKNRGYDSCGLYLNNKENKKIMEKIGIDGKLMKKYKDNNDDRNIFVHLEENLKKIGSGIDSDICIGHSRWATHGGKTDENSHPHTSNNESIVIVHNGIISNYKELINKYIPEWKFKSETDSEVVANLIQYFKNKGFEMLEILNILTNEMEGTWALIIHDNDSNRERLYFMKNESPLLISENNKIKFLTSEPSGFLNMTENYILLREKTYGYIDKKETKIIGDYKIMDVIKSDDNDITLSNEYDTWMMKEIEDQCDLKVLNDPLTNNLRFDNNEILFNFDMIKKCKYLYIIACGSSYYAGLIASNYFRFTKAFEFVNVIDGGEFTKAHLETIDNPEKDLLVLIISQSGETRDLNLAVSICREHSSNRIKMKKNKLLKNFDPLSELINTSYENLQHLDNEEPGEIKIIGIINVVGSLIARRTINNIYTNVGRENSVASTKSCTAQILVCLLLAIYKSKLNDKLNTSLENKFNNDLIKLKNDIKLTIELKNKIKEIASNILKTNKKSIFILGKDELHGAALEGALKIKEVAYIHAEGFNITALKHGPYALLEKDVTVIIIYKNRDHFIKSIIEEIKTREANVIEISAQYEGENGIRLPDNRTFIGLLSVVAMQLLSYYLSVLQGINPDTPRNLAKVVTVD
jgi:glutamine---fructose-6-phosphate transaminase (isomerizing)